MKLDKYYTVGDYWIDISLSSQNAIFDIWFCRDTHVFKDDGFPYWNFRFSLLKFEINIHPSIF